MMWQRSHRADPVANRLAKRHYSCQTPESAQFVKPGRCLVLVTPGYTALWVTSWPFAHLVKHAWPGAWECSLFRHEGPDPYRAADLIRAAVACTRWRYGPPPAEGMVTFIDPDKVRPTRVHGAQVWGWTYRRAGFVEAGTTAGGLLCLQLLPSAMPDPMAPAHAQFRLWEDVA